MRGLAKKIFLGVTAALIACVGGTTVAFAAEASTATAVYESFDEYDTVTGRFGEGNALEAMKGFFGTSVNQIDVALSDPIGSETGRSLKITQKTGALDFFWTNGTKDRTKMDQTGAKYLKFYVRNLSADARDIIIYITDVTQVDIDAAALPEYADTGKIPESQQEHWTPKWNAPAILETMSGEKTFSRSARGQSVTLPKDFEGAVYVPLADAYIEQPSWWLAENRPWRNDVLDLDKIMAVSFGMFDNTAIDSAQPDTWTVFEVDNVSFGTDDSVDTFIEQSVVTEGVAASKVVRPTTDAIKVDYAASVIRVGDGMTVDQFGESFSLPKGYTLTVTDEFGFNVYGDDVMADNWSALFTDGTTSFMYIISVSTAATEPTPEQKQPVEKTGLSGTQIGLIVGGSILGAVVLGGVAVYVIVKKKKGGKENA